MRLPFRGVVVREAMLVRGPRGWGEFAPFAEYGDAESAWWLASAIEAAYAGWPGPLRSRVPVNATVPAVDPSQVPGVLARFDGCRTVKVKVAQRGQSLADDVARVAAVRAASPAGTRLRIDANGAWSVLEAVRAIGELSAYGLEYAEQPCASVEELRDLRIALVRHGIAVPIAADESIRKAADPHRVVALEAADLIVVKVAPLGGVRRALAVVADCGLPAVVSSALDTSVGIAAGLALAGALPVLEHDCGLGTVELLESDVVVDSLVPQEGSIRVIRSAGGGGGLNGGGGGDGGGGGGGDGRGGLEVSSDRLAALAAAPDRVAWWSARLARCYGHLAG